VPFISSTIHIIATRRDMTRCRLVIDFDANLLQSCPRLCGLVATLQRGRQVCDFLVTSP